MDHLEEVALTILQSAPVNSPDLMDWRDKIVTDAAYAEWLAPVGDYPDIDAKFARAFGSQNLALARQEQRATYFLAVNIVAYRKRTPDHEGKAWTAAEELTNAIRDYHLAIMHAHTTYMTEILD